MLRLCEVSRIISAGPLVLSGMHSLTGPSNMLGFASREPMNRFCAALNGCKGCHLACTVLARTCRLCSRNNGRGLRNEGSVYLRKHWYPNTSDARRYNDIHVLFSRLWTLNQYVDCRQARASHHSSQGREGESGVWGCACGLTTILKQGSP